MNSRKRPSTLAADLLWCHAHLSAGRRVWCVRRRISGLVVSYVAGDISAWEVFDDSPVGDFTVESVYAGQTGAPVFGPECAWPKKEES